MSSLDQFAEAFESLQRAWAENRLAHAYVIGGSPTGAGKALAQSLLKLLFCEGAEPPCGACANCGRVERRQHPDISWVEPEKKSRVIGVEQIRELNQRLEQTAYAGGWKAGVLLGCDRLNEQAANAFLKTLEEPPGRTLLLLVTDQVQSLLPTIVSRCQRVVLDEGREAPFWHDALMEILQTSALATDLDALLLAGRLRELLEGIKARIQEEIKDPSDPAEKEADNNARKEVLAARVQAGLLRERAEMLRLLQNWQRDLLACACGAPDETIHFRDQILLLRQLAAGQTTGRLLARVRDVDRAVRLLELNMSEAVALESCLLGRAPVTA